MQDDSTNKNILQTMEEAAQRFFPKVRMTLAALSVLLFIWLYCHLFIRSCGGPFPQRTQGPFVKDKFIQLGMLPDWENMLIPKEPGVKQTYPEMLNKGLNLYPSLEFEYPENATASIGAGSGVSAEVKPSN